MQLHVPLLHLVNHRRNPPNDINALLHIELTHLSRLLITLQLVENVTVLLAQSAHGLQPHINDAELLVAESTSNATAGCVAADNNMLDLEVLDSVLDHREHVDVCRADDVGDVAVREDFAGLKAEDCGLGHARVGASDPEATA